MPLRLRQSAPAYATQLFPEQALESWRRCAAGRETDSIEPVDLSFPKDRGISGGLIFEPEVFVSA
jgi:hypothetical protein